MLDTVLLSSSAVSPSPSFIDPECSAVSPSFIDPECSECSVPVSAPRASEYANSSHIPEQLKLLEEELSKRQSKLTIVEFIEDHHSVK